MEKQKCVKTFLAFQRLPISTPNGFSFKPSHVYCLHFRAVLASSHVSWHALCHLGFILSSCRHSSRRECCRPAPLRLRGCDRGTARLTPPGLRVCICQARARQLDENQTSQGQPGPARLEEPWAGRACTLRRENHHLPTSPEQNPKGTPLYVSPVPQTFSY